MTTTMVNVGGTLYRSDQQFDFSLGDFGASGTIDAAAAARLLQQNTKWRGGNGSWGNGDDAGSGSLTVKEPILKQE